MTEHVGYSARHQLFVASAIPDNHCMPTIVMYIRMYHLFWEGDNTRSSMVCKVYKHVVIGTTAGRKGGREGGREGG